MAKYLNIPFAKSGDKIAVKADRKRSDSEAFEKRKHQSSFKRCYRGGAGLTRKRVFHLAIN